MKKIFLFCFTAFNAIAANLHAQTVCDTINMPVPGNWSSTSYEAPSPFPGYYAGYINGVNGYGDYQKANYFDLSATSYTYIRGALIKFGKANSTKSTNLTKTVTFRLYGDNAGVPGTILATTTKTLQEIKDAVALNLNVAINFSPVVAMPAGKKFYIGADFSNFSWTLGGTTRDSVWIAGTADNEVLPNAAWQLSKVDSTWQPYTDFWTNPNNPLDPLDITLWIFPYVSTAVDGCAVLPVQLLSFTAKPNGKDVQLNWNVSNELNMKNYTVQRAENNGLFVNAGTVNAVNSYKNQSYSFTDKNAFAHSSTVQYRLAQNNSDGSVQYSKVIAVKGSTADISFANPFNGTLQVSLSLMNAEKVSIGLYDMQGRSVAAVAPATYNAATNIINITASATLPKGTYILKIIAGEESYTYKVVKQ